MDKTERRETRRYPLHVTISMAFTVLLAIFGLALIGFNYVETRKMVLLEAERLLEQIDTQMQENIEDLYQPVQNVIHVSSKILPHGDVSPDERARVLGFVSEILRIKPGISSIFTGFDDGDFVLMRCLDAWPGIRQTVGAPDEASYVVQIIERESAESARQDWLFLDRELRPVLRETRPWTGYDPRERDWYRTAMATSEQVASEFYVLFTTQEVGATIAQRLAGGGGVVGADLTLNELSVGLARHRVTPSTRIAMLQPGGGVIALSEPMEDLVVRSSDSADVTMPHLSALDDPLYRRLAEELASGKTDGQIEREVDGRMWTIALSILPTEWGKSIVLATMVPRDELLADVIRLRNHSLLISAGLLLAALIIVVGLSRHISKSLRTLAREAEQIRELRFDAPITVRSRIEEVGDLAATMAVMKSSLQQFLAISHGLSAEKDFDHLLEMILDESLRVSDAQAGAILLRSEDDEQLDVALLRFARSPESGTGAADKMGRFDPVSLRPADRSGRPSIELRTAESGSVARIDDTSAEQPYELDAVRTRFAVGAQPLRSIMCVPLRNPQNETIGVLELVNARVRRDGASGFRDETVPYIEALSSNAAIAIDNRRLLKAQKDLLESFIHVVAGAIDAKSPYTHGHCQRVPEVARLLAEAAHQSDEGPFADFALSGDDWYALHLASWLHDCGKVTTPEYVVDKATKLETIYNRIHEIRTRFEVLLRDARIDYLEALRRDDVDEDALRHRLEQRQAGIRDDFEFLASCNTGAPMTDEMVERVQRIGAQTWVRHLDDRLGLSHGELSRTGPDPRIDLPVEQALLSDTPAHVVPRDDGGHPFGDNHHGFHMDVPEHLYNQGEIHNLCIRRGTLTDEERFKINEHVIQTIRMLGRLPFPRELRQVPDWAGNHHERLDGRGYPRRLQAEGLSVPERIMAMADIFEALTAMDRPYMPPKKLSQAIAIMRSMCDAGHLCPELFALFLRSGVYLRYADEYLDPEQLDKVDVDGVLGPVSV